MIAGQGRNITNHLIGDEFKFTVHQHIILRNHWEYYLGGTDEDGVAYGYVMGMSNEWGSVSMEELKPYIVGEGTGKQLNHILPPFGYHWEDECSLQSQPESGAS